MATKTVSILTGGSNSHTTSSEEVNGIYTDILSNGIVGAITATSGVAPTTGGFAVNAQGTPDMTVAVTAGVAYVTGTPTGGNSQRFRVSMATSENVTIAANSTGGTRYDHIYIKLDADKLATPNTAGDDVATLVASRSTSASTDNGTPPTYGYKIAVVTVANGASSIANANITDSRAQSGVSAISPSANNIVAANNLSTSAITLGYASITSSWTSTTTSSTQVTGLSTTVTIPAGSRRVKITAWCGAFYHSTNPTDVYYEIWDGTVGSGTRLAYANHRTATTNHLEAVTAIAVVSPAAGSKTYNIGAYSAIAGTTTVSASSTQPAFILVEAI